MENLIINLTSYKIRYESYDNKQYIVAPATLIVEGVLNGSKGPVLYTEDEIKASVPHWDHTPLVLNHPAGGARKPDVIEKFGLGLLFNTQYTDKLISEAWFDVEKTKRIDPSIYNKLIRGQPIELSTGLGGTLTTAEIQNNTFLKKNGKQIKFDYKISGLVPDHLAVLPADKGACSLEDGCGINNKESETETAEVENKTSFSDIRKQLYQKLEEKYSTQLTVVYIIELYKDSVVFEISSRMSEQNKSELFRLAYSESKGVVSLSNEDPVQVIKKTEFIPVTNKDAEAMTKENQDTKKKELIDNLIKNCSCTFKEEDRANLENFDVDRLENLQSLATKKKEESTEEKKEPEVVNNSEKKTEEPAKITFENLPPEVQETVLNAKRIEDREKGKLIEKLTSHVKDESKKTKLIENFKNKKLTELEDMVDMIPDSPQEKEQEQNQPSYFGGSFVSNSSTQKTEVENKQAEEDILAMVPPPMDWSK